MPAKTKVFTGTPQDLPAGDGMCWQALDGFTACSGPHPDMETAVNLARNSLELKAKHAKATHLFHFRVNAVMHPKGNAWHALAQGDAYRVIDDTADKKDKADDR